MNKFVRELFDGMFDIKENAALQIIFFIGFLFLLTIIKANIAMLTGVKPIDDSQTLILIYLLLLSFVGLGWIYIKLTRYLLIGSLLVFIGFIASRPNVINFAVAFVAVGTIINALYLIGHLIEKIKKKKPKKVKSK